MNNNLFENTKYYIENNNISKNRRIDLSNNLSNKYITIHKLLIYNNNNNNNNNNNIYVYFNKYTDFSWYYVEKNFLIPYSEPFDKDTMENRIYFLEKIINMELDLS
jgi:hypothetical protein